MQIFLLKTEAQQWREGYEEVTQPPLSTFKHLKTNTRIRQRVNIILCGFA